MNDILLLAGEEATQWPDAVVVCVSVVAFFAFFGWLLR